MVILAILAAIWGHHYVFREGERSTEDSARAHSPPIGRAVDGRTVSPPARGGIKAGAVG